MYKQLEGYNIDDERKLQSIAFWEVASFIEEALMNTTNQKPPLKLSDYIKLYNPLWRKLGAYCETWFHST